MIILGVGSQHAAWSSNWELLDPVRVTVKAENVKVRRLKKDASQNIAARSGLLRMYARSTCSVIRILELI
jgi:hypothetical protein